MGMREDDFLARLRARGIDLGQEPQDEFRSRMESRGIVINPEPGRSGQNLTPEEKEILFDQSRPGFAAGMVDRITSTLTGAWRNIMGRPEVETPSELLQDPEVQDFMLQQQAAQAIAERNPLIEGAALPSAQATGVLGAARAAGEFGQTEPVEIQPDVVQPTSDLTGAPVSIVPGVEATPEAQGLSPEDFRQQQDLAALPPEERAAREADIAQAEGIQARGQAAFEGQGLPMRAATSVARGVREAPGVIGAATRALGPENPPAADRLLEAGLAEPSNAETALSVASSFAPVLAEIAATRGAAKLMAPKVGGKAGDLLRVVGAGGSGTRGSGAVAGALEGIPTDLAIALEQAEPGSALFGTAIGSLFGFLLPGGGKLADELVDAAKKDPRGTADALVQMGEESGRMTYVGDQLAQAARENEELAAMEQAFRRRVSPEPEAPKQSEVQQEIARRKAVREKATSKPKVSDKEAAVLREVDEANEAARVARETETPEARATREAEREPEPVRAEEPDEDVRTESQQRELDFGLQPVREPLPLDVPTERRQRNRRSRALVQEVRELRTDPLSGLTGGVAATRAVRNIDANPNQEFLGYDISRFKQVNDTLSPEVGDQVIGLVGNAIRQANEEFGIGLRDSMRRGGDEFGQVVDAAMPAARREEIMARTREIFQESLTPEMRATGVDLRHGTAGTWSDAQEAAAKMIGKTAREPEQAARAATDLERGSGGARQVADIIANWGRKSAESTAEAADDFKLNPNVARAVALPALAVGAAALPSEEVADPMDRALLGLTAGAVLAMGPRTARALYNNSPRFRKWFTPGGAVPGAAREISTELSRALQHALPRAKGYATRQQQVAKRNLRDLGDAVNREYRGVGTARSRISQALQGQTGLFKQIPTDHRKSLKEFMEGDSAAIGRLPEALREPVRNMRAHIDEMSRVFIDNDIVAGELAVKFDDEMGAYLTRAYRVFEDPDWAKNAPKILGDSEWQRRVNQFKRWYRDNVYQATDDEMERIMGDFLARGESENPLKFLKSGAVGRLDGAILKKRKDIPIEIREFWGEIEDPMTQYAQTIANQAGFIGNYEFLRGLAEGGQVGGLLFKPQIDPATGQITNLADMDTRFTHEFTSESLRPLQGLRTTPEFGRAMEEAWSVTGSKQPNPILRTFIALSLASKATKTVGSQIAQIRNVAGNMVIMAANGYWSEIPAVTKAGWDATVGQVADALGMGGKRAPYRQAQFDKLVELGVIADNARSSELRRVWHQVSGDTVTKFSDSRIGQILTAPVRAAQGAYRAGDDIPKLIAFGVEQRRLRRAFPDMPEAEIEQRAASIVRNLFPTLSMTPESTRAISQIGGFSSFTSEMFRTTSNFFRQVQQELADPATRQIGMQRVAGAMSAVGMNTGLSMTSKQVNHISPEQEEATRILMPPWSANSELIFTGPVDDGSVAYVDGSYTNPYSFFAKPLVAFFRNQSPQQVLRETFWEFAEPWVAGSPLATELWDAVRRSEDESVEASALFGALMDGLEPSIIEQWQRARTGVTSAGHPLDRKQEFLNLFTGVRQSTVDARTQFRFSLNAWREQVASAAAPLRAAVERGNVPARRDPGVTFEHLQEATQRDLTRIYQEYAEQLWAVQAMGVPRSEARKMLADARVSEEDRRTLMQMADEFGAYMSGGGARQRTQDRMRRQTGMDRSVDLAGWSMEGNELGLPVGLAMAGAVVTRKGRIASYSQRVSTLAERIAQRYGDEGAMDMLNNVLGVRSEKIFRDTRDAGPLMTDPRGAARIEVGQNVSDALREIRRVNSGRTTPIVHGTTAPEFDAARTIGNQAFGFHAGLSGVIDLDDVRDMVLTGKQHPGAFLNMFSQLWDYKPTETARILDDLGPAGRQMRQILETRTTGTRFNDSLEDGFNIHETANDLFHLNDPVDVIARTVQDVDPAEIVALEFAQFGDRGRLIEGWARSENPLELNYDFGGFSARGEMRRLVEEGVIDEATEENFLRAFIEDIMEITEELEPEEFMRRSMTDPGRLQEQLAQYFSNMDVVRNDHDRMMALGRFRDVILKYAPQDEAELILDNFEHGGAAFLSSSMHRILSQLQLREALEFEGYDSIVYVNNAEFPGNKSIIMFRPDQIRDQNAKFRPSDDRSIELMAGITGAAVGGQALRAATGENDEVVERPQ